MQHIQDVLDRLGLLADLIGIKTRFCERGSMGYTVQGGRKEVPSPAGGGEGEGLSAGDGKLVMRRRLLGVEIRPDEGRSE